MKLTLALATLAVASACLLAGCTSTNGTSYDSPYLVPGDSFVERWEIDEAARKYEAELNS